MIIAVLNEKGGVGKTTNSINIAHGLQELGNKVLLVDSDTLGCTRDWHAASGGTLLNVIGLDRPTIYKDVNNLKDQYDHIVIDGSPRLSNMVAATLKCSDLVVIPVKTSAFEIKSPENMIEVVQTRQLITEGKLKACLLMNMCRKTLVTDHVRKELENYGLPVLKSYIKLRVIYEECTFDGSTAISAGYDKEATKEIFDVIDEIMRL